MKKEIILILTTFLIWVLTACGKSENPPISAQDFVKNGIGTIQDAFDSERKKLQELSETPSVTEAFIKNTQSQNNPNADRYAINLDNAVASIAAFGQDKVDYVLNDEQVNSLRRLLSEYALTVYDDKPYWPTSKNYCTMIELFDYTIYYEGGVYKEYGATHYPEGWDDFIENLEGIIISEEEIF